MIARGASHRGRASVAVALFALASVPEPEISESVHYYAFGGTTLVEMNEQLRVRGPSTAEGSFHAETKWYVKWSYDYDKRPGSCGLGPVKTIVTVDVRLPKWSRPARASRELAVKWDAYLSALRTHEYGHREIGIRAAREVARVMTGVPRQSTCHQVEQAADAAGERVLDEARVRERDYDRRTNHGATQGALFR